jgi:hypothetical protein
MNTKICVITLASSFGLIILGSILSGILESSGTITKETLDSSAIQIIYFALFCIASFSLVPVVIRFFIFMQIKIGNAEFFLVRWFQANEQTIVYCVWTMMVVGLCISLPAAIADGFFK